MKIHMLSLVDVVEYLDEDDNSSLSFSVHGIVLAASSWIIPENLARE
jgi:hypothetical protein